MARIIRRTVKKRGAALIVALQLTVLTLISLVSFVGGPQQSAKAPADSQVKSSSSASSYSSADQTDQTQTQTDQAQTQTAQPLTAADLTAAQREALRASAHPAKKLYEPLASQVFSLAQQRIADQAAQRSAQGPEAPDEGPTL